MSRVLMEVNGLAVHFKARKRTARALDGISLEWRRGEILGVVGESGCGKSTLARAMLALVKPAAGEVSLEGKPTSGRGSVRELRRRVQMIFQDPYQTLNPRQRVKAIVTEPLVVQGVPKDEHDARVQRAMEDVGLTAGRFLTRYPHQLPGASASAPVRVMAEDDDLLGAERFAAITPHSPTAPSPTTAAIVPGATPAARAAW